MREDTRTVVPQVYAGLRGHTWSLDPTKPISASDAFGIYERNWQFIDEGALAADERHLMADLTVRFGRGVFLGRG